MEKETLILVVDDDNDMLNIIKDHLKKHNYLVMCAKNIVEAKDLITHHDINLIITDLKMPEGSGVALMTWVKKSFNTPVLLMTAFSALLETKEAAALGIKNFLGKPFTEIELISTIKKLLEHSETHSEKPESIEDQFTKIPIKEFIYGSHIKFPIYIKLSKSKFVRLASGGENLDKQKIENYEEKNIKHLYLTKDDYKEYTRQTITFARALLEDNKTSLEAKKRFLIHTGKVVIEKIYTNEINKESLYEARKLINLTMDTLTDDHKIFDLIKIINSKDDTFYTHQLAVAVYSIILAKKMGWDSIKTNLTLALGGIFHDIGKKNIPEGIINKHPRELTINDKEILDRHPTNGVAILNKINQFPSEVIQIVSQHHENCDGTGYPSKIRKTQIFPLARLIAVIDRFCNLVIKSYSHDPISPIQAIQEMEDRYITEIDSEIFGYLKDMVRNN